MIDFEKELTQEKHNIEPVMDLTDFDFTNSQLYVCKSDLKGFEAYQLQKDEIIEHPWGIQDMKVGDWVVLKPSSRASGFKKSGVKREAFDKAYVDLENGRFRKESFVKVEKIEHHYRFIGIDSDEHEFAPAGSYIVLNLDKHQKPIVINGRRDIFYYKEDDLISGYNLVQPEI